MLRAKSLPLSFPLNQGSDTPRNPIRARLLAHGSTATIYDPSLSGTAFGLRGLFITVVDKFLS